MSEPTLVDILAGSGWNLRLARGSTLFLRTSRSPKPGASTRGQPPAVVTIPAG